MFGHKYQMQGRFSHSQKIFCDLPTVGISDEGALAHEFGISVTNDGRNYSDRKSLLVFDSTCIKCFNGFCQQKVRCFNALVLFDMKIN